MSIWDDPNSPPYYPFAQPPNHIYRQRGSSSVENPYNEIVPDESIKTVDLSTLSMLKKLQDDVNSKKAETMKEDGYNDTYMGMLNSQGTFFVHIKSIKEVATNSGTGKSLLVKAYDRLGRRCFWFSDLGTQPFQQDECVLLSAIVKNHTTDRFESYPTTYLTRVRASHVVPSSGSVKSVGR